MTREDRMWLDYVAAESRARLAHEARNDAAVALSPLVTAAIRRAVEAYTERATTPSSRVSA